MRCTYLVDSSNFWAANKEICPFLSLDCHRALDPAYLPHHDLTLLDLIPYLTLPYPILPYPILPDLSLLERVAYLCRPEDRWLFDYRVGHGVREVQGKGLALVHRRTPAVAAHLVVKQ